MATVPGSLPGKRSADALQALTALLDQLHLLVGRADNDFAWTPWADAAAAQAEIATLRNALRAGRLPERAALARLFAPTGALQELALSSGWAEAYLQLAAAHDALPEALWHPEPVGASLRSSAQASSWPHTRFGAGVALPWTAHFTLAQASHLREGLIPRSMDEKWFVYFEAPHLYLHRSWTGQPVYRLTLQETATGVIVSESLWALELAEAAHANPTAELRSLEYLIQSLLQRPIRRR